VCDLAAEPAGLECVEKVPSGQWSVGRLETQITQMNADFKRNEETRGQRIQFQHVSFQLLPLIPSSICVHLSSSAVEFLQM